MRSCDFIAFVANPVSRALVRTAIATFRRSAQLSSEGVAAPAFIPGVAWSDQWGFWLEGFPAIMVTDTALYRYREYHTEGDTAEKLNYAAMAELTRGLHAVIEDLGS